MSSATRAGIAGLAAIAITLAFAACSSNSNNNSSSTTTQTTSAPATTTAAAGAVCNDWKGLQAALEKLTTVPGDLASGKTAQAQNTIAAVAAQAQILAGSAQVGLEPIVTALHDNIEKAKDKLAKIKSGSRPSLSDIGAITAALAAAGASATTLSTKLSQRCS